jgi:hypothetical protein
MEKYLRPTGNPNKVSACAAYWDKRSEIAAIGRRIQYLYEAVDHPGDLTLSQWAQIMSLTWDFEPDLIVELGRGRGNSTCAFTETMNRLGRHKGFVVSICNSEDWERMTRARVAQVVPRDWFEPLVALRCDIREVDLVGLFRHARRCLIFWDAHGYDVAECVLGGILPLIAEKEHLVVMHDLGDTRYAADESRYYGEHGLWKGNDWSGPRIRLGHIDAAVEQAVAIVDFASRNGLEIQSADHSIQSGIGSHPDRVAEMQRVLGGQMFSLYAHWCYFTLNGLSGVFTFPRFSRSPWSRTGMGERAPVQAAAG